MKAAIFGLVLFGMVQAQAGDMCETKASVLTSYLAHPLLKLEAKKPGWKHYRPLLGGAVFTQNDKKVAIHYQGQIIEGDAICIDFANHKVFVKPDLKAPGKIDTLKLLESRAPAATIAAQ